MVKKLFTIAESPAKILTYYNNIKTKARQRKINNTFISNFFKNKNELSFYYNELKNSGLINLLEKSESEFNATIKGKSYRNRDYDFGKMDYSSGRKIYCLVRKLKPEILVETGVCNGVSTAFILQALYQNNYGKLYSIDLPEEQGKQYDNTYFWDGKGGAVIPKDELPGWLIPDKLRSRWELILGKSQDKLPALLKSLGEIDFFMHDSEHSYECMLFEYTEAYKYLRTNGLLLSDDYKANEAFKDFSGSVNKKVYQLNKSVGYLIKRN